MTSTGRVGEKEVPTRQRRPTPVLLGLEDPSESGQRSTEERDAAAARMKREAAADDLVAHGREPIGLAAWRSIWNGYYHLDLWMHLPTSRREHGVGT